jgi:hypothetical protein
MVKINEKASRRCYGIPEERSEYVDSDVNKDVDINIPVFF